MENIESYQKIRPLGPKSTICFAPYKSMYFKLDGTVGACCHNYWNVFGVYPKQNLIEIWNNTKNKDLRAALNNNDFSKGCFKCKNAIEAKNFSAVGALDYDLLPLNEKYPTMLEFVLSNDCNFECIMCSSKFSSAIQRKEKTNFDYKSPYDDNFVEQLEELIPHLVNAKFLGGEPFMIPIYHKIWKKIVELNPKCMIFVQTNGSILNDYIKNLINSGNFIISASIDSINPSTYELIRKNSKLEEVLQNVTYFANHSKEHNYHFGISVCPLQQNWNEIPEIIEWGNNINADIYFNTVWLPMECSLHSLNHSELKRIIDYWLNSIIYSTLEIEKRNAYRFQCLINLVESWYTEKLNLLDDKSQNTHYAESHQYGETLSLSEIFTLLINHINSNLNPEDLSSIELYRNKLNKVIFFFEDESMAKDLLIRLISLPAEMLINDLEYNDSETLYRKGLGLIRNI